MMHPSKYTSRFLGGLSIYGIQCMYFKNRLQVIHVNELCHQYSSFFLSPPHFSPLFLGDYSGALFFHLTLLRCMCWFHVFGVALPISHISTSNEFLTSKRIAYFPNATPINMKSEIVKDERLLISNHLDWSFYLANHKQVLDFVLVPCASHSILCTNAGTKLF